MLDSFADWVERHISGYTLRLGDINESQADYPRSLCVIQQSGGVSPTMGVRFPRFRVFLLGPRNGGAHAKQILGDANKLVIAAMDHLDVPCKAANVKTLVEPIGPNFTKEGRAWTQLDFEIIF